MSGHSKWANIKHRKDSVDRARGRIFHRIVRELMVAARLGGADPDANSRLRIAISKARASNMPRDTMERAIKKGAGELEGQTFEEVVYEAYAPGGVGLIIEALTDKKSRTTPEIKSILAKYGASLAESNAVSRLFQRQAFIMIPRRAIDESTLFELAIEAGAQDVGAEEEYYVVLGAPEDYAQLQESLAARDVPSAESSIRMSAMEGAEKLIDDADAARKILTLVEKLEDHDDVQAVYHNMDVSDSLLSDLQQD
ncbi:MAG: YebC/PmpR family DNA-binding transcriptional regulator [Leptospirales bacterium]|nr:YebC/PmpR family DNA-binding transcriptional regulator [Leptospirales bacterium]